MRAPGEGSLYKRKVKRKDGSTYERWQAALVIGRKADGKLDRVYGPYRGSQGEARADLSALRAQHEAGTPPDRQRLGEYLDEWLAAARKRLKRRTVDDYARQVRLRIGPTLGATRLCDLKPAHIDRLIRQIEDDSTAAARQTRAVLHKALGDAARQERIHRNPVASVAAPRAPRAELDQWTPKHAWLFLEVAKGHRLHPLFHLILVAGLRAGEALGLFWGDLDRDTLEIRRQLVTVGQPRFETPKTKRSHRRIRLEADTLDVLTMHRERMTEEGQRGELVFPSVRGTPLRLENVRRVYKRFIQEAGVPPIRIHDLRHFSLSRLIALGYDPATVSQRAGHSRTSTTMDIYVRAFEEQMDRMAVSASVMVEPDPEALAKLEQARRDSQQDRSRQTGRDRKSQEEKDGVDVSGGKDRTD